jgi:hypothetical protein
MHSHTQGISSSMCPGVLSTELFISWHSKRQGTLTSGYLARPLDLSTSCLWSMEPEPTWAHHVYFYWRIIQRVLSVVTVPLQVRPPKKQPNNSLERLVWRQALSLSPGSVMGLGTENLTPKPGSNRVSGKRGCVCPQMVVSLYKNSVRPSGPWGTSLQEDRWEKPQCVLLSVAKVIRKSTDLNTFVFFFFEYYWFSRLTSRNPGCGKWTEKSILGAYRGFFLLQVEKKNSSTLFCN